MNTDYLRTQSWHIQALNRFIDHENLYISLYHETADVSCTYSNDYNNEFTTLDHILLSKSLSDYIFNYSSLRENVENQSDHAPVVLSLNIFIQSHSYTPSNHISRKN